MLDEAAHNSAMPTSPSLRPGLLQLPPSVLATPNHLWVLLTLLVFATGAPSAWSSPSVFPQGFTLPGSQDSVCRKSPVLLAFATSVPFMQFFVFPLHWTQSGLKSNFIAYLSNTRASCSS